jgi:hypothetical protein
MAEGGGFRIKSGMTGRRKEPRWVIAFLRALGRTGVARTAAKDAGIDFSTAYARRRAHSEFAERWAEALAAYQARVKAEEEAAIAALKKAPLPPAASLRVPPVAGSNRRGEGPLPDAPAEGGGAEHVVSGGKVRRVGYGRWGKEKERIFFEVLAGTGNIRSAADAAGVSTNTILARRQKNRLFAAKFDVAVQNAKVAVELFLAQEARRALDPEMPGTGDVRPRMTIDQAIKISQRSAAKGSHAAAETDPFAEDGAANGARDIEGVRQRLETALNRVRDHHRRRQRAAGWTFDESYDLMIPPGYVQGPDYRPKPPHEPSDSDEW